MTEDANLRNHLLELLRGKGAHIPFDRAVHAWPEESRGSKPSDAGHSAWQLLEHMRIAQWDILKFSKSADHVSPKFPDGYWPETEAPGSSAAWQQSLEAFREDAAAMQALVSDPARDLYEPFPWGDGQTLLRETFVVADHNAYHLGQLVQLRKSLRGESR